MNFARRRCVWFDAYAESCRYVNSISRLDVLTAGSISCVLYRGKLYTAFYDCWCPYMSNCFGMSQP